MTQAPASPYAVYLLGAILVVTILVVAVWIACLVVGHRRAKALRIRERVTWDRRAEAHHAAVDEAVARELHGSASSRTLPIAERDASNREVK